MEFYPSVSLGTEATKNYISEWLLIAKEVGAERFDEVVTEHIRESRFFPTVAELRERAGMSKKDGDSREALEHWDRLKRFINTNYYEDLGGLQNEDKLPLRVRYAMRLVGGARALYFMDLESEPFKKKDFIEAYRVAPADVRGQIKPLGEVLARCLEAGDDEA
jgi:hypothetical protein